MTDDLKFNVSFACGVAVFVCLFYFLVIKLRTRGNRLKEKAEKAGCVAIAKEIKDDYRRFTGSDGKYRSEIVTYEYFVDGKSYKKKITFTDTGIVMKYPNQVTIYYDKNNPHKSYADVELGKNVQMQTGCCTTIFTPIIVIIVIYNLLVDCKIKLNN